MIEIGQVPRSSRPYRDERAVGPRLGHHSSIPYGLRRFQKAETLRFIPFSCFHRLPFLEAPGIVDIVQGALEQRQPLRYRHAGRGGDQVGVDSNAVARRRFAGRPGHNSGFRSRPWLDAAMAASDRTGIDRLHPSEKMHPLRQNV